MLKQIVNRLFSLLLLLSFMAIGTYINAQEVYKIGAIFSITGPGSSLGIPEKNTIEC